MIHINELRLGNWVMDEFGEWMRVHQLGHIVNPTYICAKSKERTAYNEFYPIALTAEVLSQFGFVKHHTTNQYWIFYKLMNGWHVGLANQDEPSAGVKKGFVYYSDDYHEIKYLHQLQNLYFALVGKELEFRD